MFGNWFYHQRIRKTVATFGSLFNNLNVVRHDAAGKVMSTVRVPLAYAPRDKFLQRIRENADLENDTKTAVQLPRMSFEVVNFAFDPERAVAKTKKVHVVNSETGDKKLMYAGVPYNVYFQLNIYAKTQDDALQVVEQIVPYFAPQYTLTVKPFADYPSILEDNPLTIQSASFSDDYESPVDQRRTIIYTLEFEMKTSFYGPIGDSSIIREVQTNFYLWGADSDTLASRLTVVPDPIDADPDDDYGFTTTKIDYIG